MEGSARRSSGGEKSVAETKDGKFSEVYSRERVANPYRMGPSESGSPGLIERAP